MKTILRLLLNDLRRDLKRPWSLLLLTAMPLVLSLLIASVFGGRGGSGPMPTVQVAMLDQDRDLLTGLLRSLPDQGDAARHLRLHWVETREEGLRLLEQRKVSALVVLPQQLTENLLEGRTNALELYENPAEQVLPKIVREGTSLLALGLSGTAEVLGDPLRDLRQLIRADAFPAERDVSGVATNSLQKLRGLRTYLFPALVQIQTVPAAEFVPFTTNAPAAGLQP